VKEKQQEQDAGCPLGFSECYQRACRYYLPYSEVCAYERIKAMEKRRRKAQEMKDFDTTEQTLKVVRR
jgi:hypothetical protein